MTITEICNKISNLISIVRKPLTQIPAALILCGAVKRPGLSAMLIASKIIKRQAEAGRYFGNLRDGRPNPEEIMERIRIEEIINAIKSEMKVEIGVPIGGITFEGQIVGKTVKGFNINPVHGDGIAR